MAEKKSTVEVYLYPGASSNKIVRIKDNTLHVSVTALHHKGQANRALITFLAKALAVPKSNLDLVQGYTNRHKVIAIQGLSSEELREKLAQALPTK